MNEPFTRRAETPKTVEKVINLVQRNHSKKPRHKPGRLCKGLCTPGMGVNLWGESPLYVSPVNMNFVNTSISRKQGRNREGPSEGSWSAKL